MKLTGVITIEGKEYYYALTPKGSSPPITGPHPEGVRGVMLLSHEEKSGTTGAGKPFRMHKFRASDNRTYCTFDGPTAADLSRIVGSQDLVSFLAEKNKFNTFDIRQYTIAPKIEGG